MNLTARASGDGARTGSTDGHGQDDGRRVCDVDGRHVRERDWLDRRRVNLSSWRSERRAGYRSSLRVVVQRAVRSRPAVNEIMRVWRRCDIEPITGATAYECERAGRVRD